MQTTPGHVITVRAAFDVTHDYLRAIAKVAFHYFLLRRPEYKGAEPIFHAVRQFILGGDGLEFGRDITPVAPITEQVQRGGGLPRWTHFLAGEITYDELAVGVQLFVGPETVLSRA